MYNLILATNLIVLACVCAAGYSLAIRNTKKGSLIILIASALGALGFVAVEIIGTFCSVDSFGLAAQIVYFIGAVLWSFVALCAFLNYRKA